MEVEREITDLQATISELHANIRELRTEVAELKKWIGAVASRPDPNRVIGPRPGQPPSPGWKNREHTVYPMPNQRLTKLVPGSQPKALSVRESDEQVYADPLGDDWDAADR